MRVGNIIISILLACVVASCFTGVENTGRITDKDVSRVKANRITAEEEILDTVSLQSFNQWKQGKRFFITNNDIKAFCRFAQRLPPFVYWNRNTTANRQQRGGGTSI